MKTLDLTLFPGARPIPGFDGYYATANGEIVSTVRGQPKLRRKVKYRGRYFVRLRGIMCVVGTLVCSAFHRKPEADLVAIHRDGLLDDRPDNLFWGTEADVIARNVRQGLHPYGERHGMRKLTDVEVKAIRTAEANGATSAALAERFKVTRGCIGHIVSGKTWQHLLPKADEIIRPAQVVANKPKARKPRWVLEAIRRSRSKDKRVTDTQEVAAKPSPELAGITHG